MVKNIRSILTGIVALSVLFLISNGLLITKSRNVSDSEQTNGSPNHALRMSLHSHWAAQASAPEVFQSVESFQSLSLGSINGQNGWTAIGNSIVTTDPENSGNRVLALQGEDIDAYRSLPQGIANGTTGTIFYRMRRTGNADAFGGGSDVANPSNWPDFEVQVGGQEDSATSLKIVDNGGPAAVAGGGFITNQWHCIWIVADNASDTYQVHALGGNYNTQERVFADNQSTFDFRNGTNGSIQTFYTRMGFDTGTFYVDDIYVDATQQNLAVPSGASCGSSPLEPTLVPTITPSNTPALSGWVVTERFDGLSNGAINGRSGWTGTGNSAVTADPVNSSNSVLILDGPDIYAYRSLEQGVANGTTGTIFFRTRRTGRANAFAGGADVGSPSDWADYEVQMGGLDANPEDMRIRNGGQWADVDNGFRSDQWHCIWMVANNSSDTYEVYAQGGRYDSQARLNASGDSVFNFRNGTGSSIQTFFVRVGLDLGAIYIDDIFTDPGGENRTVPSGVSCGGSEPPTATFTPTPTFTPTFTPTPTPTFTPAAASVVCFPLTLSFSGTGAALQASPQNSAGCPPGDYVANEVISLTANPADGWAVSGWAGTQSNAATTAQNTVLMPNSAHSASVTYVSIEYSLTVTVAGSGTVSRSPEKPSYQFGDVVTLTASPSDGYIFNEWSGATSGVTPSIQVVVRDDTTMTANFQKVTVDCYALVLSRTGEGSVPVASPNRSPDCAVGDYVPGAVINLSAAPSIGAEVVSWTGTADDTLASTTNTVIMPAANHDVSATYSSTTYNVSFDTSGQGSITINGAEPSGTAGQYAHGSIIQLVAEPTGGWTFVGWFSENLAISSQASFAYAVTSPDNLTAIFREQPVFLSLLESTGGTVSQTPDELAYSIGTDVTLTANPEPGWEFVGWEVNVPVGASLTESTIQFTLSENTTAVARFVQNYYLALVIQTDAPPITPEPTMQAAVPTWTSLGVNRGEYSDVALHGGRLFAASRAVNNVGGGIESAMFSSQCALETGFTLRYGKPVFSIAFWSNPDAAIAGSDGNGLLYSVNGGLGWSEAANDATRRVFSVAFANENLAYATQNRQNAEVGLQRSLDSGINWEVFSADQPTNPNFVRPIESEVWFGAGVDGIRLLNLNEANASLRTVNGGLNGNAQNTWDIVGTNSQLFLATEDGVYARSRGLGDVWQGYGLQGKNVRSLAVGNGVLYAGTWDNGIWERPISVADSDWVLAGDNAGPQLKIRRLAYVNSCNGVLAAAQDGVWLLR